jgi:hypothetical protein
MTEPVIKDSRTFEFTQDGNQVACNLRAGFTSLQECNVGFGDTPLAALKDLLHIDIEARAAYTNMNAGAKSDMNQEIDQYGKSNNL